MCVCASFDSSSKMSTAIKQFCNKAICVLQIVCTAWIALFFNIEKPLLCFSIKKSGCVLSENSSFHHNLKQSSLPSHGIMQRASCKDCRYCTFMSSPYASCKDCRYCILMSSLYLSNISLCNLNHYFAGLLGHLQFYAYDYWHLKFEGLSSHF